MPVSLSSPPSPKSRTSQSRRFSWTLFCHFGREFLSPFFCCLGGFATLFTVMKLFDVLPDFLSAKAGLASMVQYFLLVEPKELLFAVIPMSALLASSFMVISLTRHHEISALRASGISLFWCCLPVWLVGLVLSLGSFSLSYWPLATRWAAEGELMLKTIDLPKTGIVKSHTEVCALSRDGLRWWTVGQFSSKGLQRDVTVTRFHAEPGKKSVGGGGDWNLAAAEAFYDKKADRWIFYDSDLAEPELRAGSPPLPKAELDRQEKAKLWKRPMTAVFRRMVDRDAGIEAKPRDPLTLVRETKSSESWQRETVFATRVDCQNGLWCFYDALVESHDDKGKLISAKSFPVWSPAPPAAGHWPVPVPAAAILNLPDIVGRPPQAFWAEGIKNFDVSKGKFTFANVLRIRYAGQQPAELEFAESLPQVSHLWVYGYDLTEAGAGMEDVARLWAATLTYEKRDGRWFWQYRHGLAWKTGEVLDPPYKLVDGFMPVFHGVTPEPEVAIADVPQDICNLNAQKDQLSALQLWQVLDQNPDMDEKTRTEYRVLAWNRCFLALMPLIAVFLGVAFSLTGERTNAASGFAKALVLLLAYYVVDQGCVIAGNAGIIPWSWLAGGGATIGFGILAVVTMWRRQ